MKKYLLLLFFAALLASCGKEEQKVKAYGAPKIYFIEIRLHYVFNF